MKDSLGAEMDGVVVTLTATNGGVLANGNSLTTGNGGTFATTLSCSTVGDCIVTATAGEATGTVTVTFEAVPFVPVLTTIAATVTPNTIASDGVEETTIVATAKDQAGDTMDGVTLTFAPTDGTTVSSESEITAGGGTATITATSTTEGAAAVVISSAGVEYSASITVGPAA